MMRIQRANTERCILGEGAVWNSRSGELVYLDIFAGKVVSFDPVSERTRTWDTGGHVGSLALCEGDRVMLGMSDTVRSLSLITGEIDDFAGPVFDGAAITVNDGTVDGNGRFILGGCSKNLIEPQPVGGLYSVDSKARVVKLDGGVYQSNGHCFSSDGRTLYCADSFLFTIFAYDYDSETGGVRDKRIFANTQNLGGRPDGSAVDQEGLLWVSLFEAGRIAAFRADGTVARLIDMPTKLISSLAFGGADLATLFVTTIDPSAFGWPAPDEEGGHLFVVEDLGARGNPERRFAG